MANWNVSVSIISLALVFCVARVHCIGYRFSESRSFGNKENQKNIEYDENPRIEIRNDGNNFNNTHRPTPEGRYGSIEVTVYAFKEKFVLNLRLNRNLFASSYVERIIGKFGITYHSGNHTDNNCYYIGSVQNREKSAASFSNCNGLAGFFAIENFSYHIETLNVGINGTTRVYRIVESSQLISGTKSNNFSKRFHLHSRRHKRSFKWPQDGDGRDKVLELYIANDNSQFVDKGRSASAVFQRAKLIANFASSLYQTLGIFFVLVGMEVWSDRDMFTISSSDVDTTLQSWYNYRMRSINPIHYNDNAVLITRVEFYNQIVGKSIIGAMCSNQYSGAIIVDKASSPSAAGSTMAHEIGHSFGLLHDGLSCSCPDPVTKCIMYPTPSSIPATYWSDCSVRQLNESFKEGLDICLYDVPQTIYEPTTSTCGNGIIENGEQCDCGKSPRTECNPSCCDSTTCKLIGSATCASGRCCNIARCQILAVGSVCRRSVGNCDLPEHCSGSATCPPDTYKQDGTSCTINGDSAYCYNGKCRSHRSQCELLWGKGVVSSSSICYQRFNTAGQHYGNCGLKWLPNVTYIACQSKDIMCGKLLCDTSSNYQLAYYKNYYLISTGSIGEYTCNSVIFDFGLKVQDPGLVPNGAHCGDGKMCINQTCIDVSSIQMPCSENCHGEQVCNNLGHCQSQSNEIFLSSSSTERFVVTTKLGSSLTTSSTSTHLSSSIRPTSIYVVKTTKLNSLSTASSTSTSSTSSIFSSQKKTTPTFLSQKKTTPTFSSQKKTTPILSSQKKTTPTFSSQKKTTPVFSPQRT